MKEDNKDVQMLKDKIQTKRNITTEVMLIQRNQIVEKTTLLKEIQRNNIKKQEVLKKLEKDERQAQEDDGIVYIEKRIYVPNNQKI